LKGMSTSKESPSSIPRAVDLTISAVSTASF
jgi:hypothetical protein